MKDEFWNNIFTDLSEETLNKIEDILQDHLQQKQLQRLKQNSIDIKKGDCYMYKAPHKEAYKIWRITEFDIESPYSFNCESYIINDEGITEGPRWMSNDGIINKSKKIDVDNFITVASLYEEQLKETIKIYERYTNTTIEFLKSIEN